MTGGSSPPSRAAARSWARPWSNRGMSSGWTRSIDSRPMRASGSVSMTQSADALIHRVVRSGSIRETTAEGARSSALSSLTATSAGIEPAAGSSDSAVILRRLCASRPP